MFVKWNLRPNHHLINQNKLSVPTQNLGLAYSPSFQGGWELTQLQR
jgi:hypothetical protein